MLASTADIVNAILFIIFIALAIVGAIWWTRKHDRHAQQTAEPAPSPLDADQTASAESGEPGSEPHDDQFNDEVPAADVSAEVVPEAESEVAVDTAPRDAELSASDEQIRGFDVDSLASQLAQSQSGERPRETAGPETDTDADGPAVDLESREEVATPMAAAASDFKLDSDADNDGPSAVEFPLEADIIPPPTKENESQSGTGQADDQADPTPVKRPIPPRKSASSGVGSERAEFANVPPPSSSTAASDLRTRPIPQRRSKPPTVTAAFSQQAGEMHTGEPDEVQVVSDYADATMHDELRELQLALEASHHELSHLTAARDQALSLASQHESQVATLQRSLAEVQRQQHELQHEREALAGLVQELNDSKSSLEHELETVRSHDQQHNATLEELRMILGQREAAEASLLRERDSLLEQAADLQRKLEQLQQLSSETNSPSNESALMADAAKAAADLDQRAQQMSAELSLANETVRQLNQNLSQRDAQMFALQRELEQRTAERNQLQAANAELDKRADDPEKAELQSKYDRAVEQLNEAVDKMSAVQQQLDDVQQENVGLTAQVNSLEAERKANADHIEALTAEVSEVRTAEQARTVELQEHTQALQAERDAANARIDVLDGELALARQDGQQKISELESQVSSLQAEHEAANGALERVKVELSESSRGEQQKSEELEKLSGQIADLQHQLALSQAAHEATTEAKTALEARFASDLQEQLSELTGQLEQREQAAEGLRAENQSLSDRNGALQEEINARAVEMRRLSERLGEAERLADAAEQQQAGFQAAEQAKQQLADQLADTESELKRVRAEQIDLKQQLAHLTDEAESWAIERSALYERFGLNERGEPLAEGPAADETERAESQANMPDEETLAELQRLQSALNERDAAIARLQKQKEEDSLARDEMAEQQADVDTIRADRDKAAASAAEASRTIANLMTELNQFKVSAAEVQARADKLAEENQEYRRSVAELHAVANELDEQKLERAREQDSARQRLLEATTANAELSAQLSDLKAELAAATGADSTQTLEQALARAEQEISQRDERLEDLATEISRLRTENASLATEVKAQQAAMQAQEVDLEKGQTRKPKAAKKATRKKTAKTTKKKATRPAVKKKGEKKTGKNARGKSK